MNVLWGILSPAYEKDTVILSIGIQCTRKLPPYEFKVVQLGKMWVKYMSFRWSPLNQEPGPRDIPISVVFINSSSHPNALSCTSGLKMRYKIGHSISSCRTAQPHQKFRSSASLPHMNASSSNLILYIREWIPLHCIVLRKNFSTHCCIDKVHVIVAGQEDEGIKVLRPPHQSTKIHQPIVGFGGWIYKDEPATHYCFALWK